MLFSFSFQYSKKMHKQVVIIIPTYNEEGNIEKTIHEVFLACATISNTSIHILIFDSQSKDATTSIVSRLQPEYPTLHLEIEPEKTGLGSAYWKAMHYSLDNLKADVVIEFDADLSHPPKALPEMLRLIDSYDVVLGSRYVKNGGISANWPWYRLWLSKLGNYVARFFLNWKYRDFTSGFRATRGVFLKRALPKQFISNHYAYKIELLWLLIQNRAKIIEYPFVFSDRTLGESKLPKNSILDSLYVVLLLRFRKIFGVFFS
jgi:dolichol-phosphate mannosyltransferase